MREAPPPPPPPICGRVYSFWKLFELIVLMTPFFIPLYRAPPLSYPFVLTAGLKHPRSEIRIVVSA